MDGQDYQAQVYAEVESDTREALVGGGASPVKAALETLRALRDTLRFAVEFKGLTLSSHLDFTANMQSRFARLVAGPPVFRSQQLMALVDAGVLHAALRALHPKSLPQVDGSFRVRSTQLQQPHEVVVRPPGHAPTWTCRRWAAVAQRCWSTWPRGAAPGRSSSTAPRWAAST